MPLSGPQKRLLYLEDLVQKQQNELDLLNQEMDNLVKIKCKETEIQLEKFRQVITQSHSMIVITNTRGEVEFINKRLTDILGYTPADLTGKLHIFTPRDKTGDEIQRKVEEALLKNGYYSGEQEVATKDGRKLWVRANVTPVIKNEKVEFYVGVMDDISLEKELKDLNRENEEKFQTIMENIPVSISLMDHDGRFTFFNNQALKNLGLSAERMGQKTIAELFPGEGPGILQAVRKVFKDKKPAVSEACYNIQGKESVFEINRIPLLDKDNKVYNVMSVAQEITENKRTEKLAKIQRAIDSLQSIGETFEDSLKILFENLFQLDWVDAGGLYLVDYEKKVLELIYHKGLSENFIKSASEYSLDSQNAQVVFAKKPRYVNMDTYLTASKENVFLEKITFIAALPLVHRDKVLGLLNLASRKVTDIDGADRQNAETIAMKVANLIELIKTRKELDLSNNELHNKLVELNLKQQMLFQKSRLESLGELSAGLAHEINQPLSVISLVMENIHYKVKQSATTEEYLTRKFTTINENINKIRKLVDHVRIFSRDQGAILFEQVDVNKVIMNALSMMTSQLRNHQVNVTVELSKNLGYTIGNPSRLEQVILNLLSNARDALREKEKKYISEGMTKEIQVNTYREADQIMIRVRDNGTGISQQNLEKIFVPFFTTKDDGHGTGLGLPIVYGIVREMKGEITVRSEAGVFTEISISLPQLKNNVE